jgi:hypothetical protein
VGEEREVLTWSAFDEAVWSPAERIAADERLDVPRILPPAPDLVDLHDASVLVADTGLTLRPPVTHR